ncbi:Putative Mn2+ efflux pump MntP (plasmid) [Nostoc flagelliforme CCNUN1]|uniref:Mn2+ efflux pump MntP n=1 Tax=Nostoc flagelliforme CCNUN1 TaxID=2038116 RepID=A0A2K8TA21_9NOSO|nr:manganese efflux pump [Nostoc flagelliforme]AUB43915.1 Putative Mn2+ efflux pump MntP [Nostoc flagelliforme CCNUN1]
MHILSALLLAIAVNVDNFAVGIAYGIKKLQIGWLTNLFIGLISAAGTYLAISVGNDIRNYLSVNVANVLGSFILIAVGIWSIWKTLKRQRRKVRMRQEMSFLVAAGSNRAISNSSHGDLSQEFSQEFLQEFSYEKFLEHPEKADVDRSGYIDVQESIALAFGLTLNNLGSGLGGGISNLNVVITTFLVFILSLLGISGGYFLGDRFTTKISGLWAGILSTSLVIITGVYEYFLIP